MWLSKVTIIEDVQKPSILYSCADTNVLHSTWMTIEPFNQLRSTFYTNMPFLNLISQRCLNCDVRSSGAMFVLDIPPCMGLQYFEVLSPATIGEPIDSSQ